MRDLTFIDMFSGAGLFSDGFADQGARPVLAVDVSKEAIASYNRNVAPVGFARSGTDEMEIPFADILIAGPPCQGFSTLGRQDPLDARNSLALEVSRWASAANTLVTVIENVPPFLSSPQWRQLAKAFESAGNEVFTWTLDAVDYGTPQHRRRAFTIASRIGIIEPPAPSLVRKTAGDTLCRPILAGDIHHSWPIRSEEHTSKLQSLMRITYAVLCLIHT